MSFDAAIKALSADALKHVKNGHVVGLGSGRAATAFVQALGRRMRKGGLDVRGIPTSAQIRLVAGEAGVPLTDLGQAASIDAAFDGADQIDRAGCMIKGGGGALLREKILYAAARRTIIMADRTKFSRTLDRPVPVEIHPASLGYVLERVRRIGGRPAIRRDARRYPSFTENGNLILDCGFGRIGSPRALEGRLARIPGVIESGLFTASPTVIYRAGSGGRYDIIT